MYRMKSSFINPLQLSVYSWVPLKLACAQVPCSAQRDPCEYITLYISLTYLLAVWNSLAGDEWCCTRPGQPYFKQELSAESVQGQPLWLFLSGNYSYRHLYTKQTPLNTCAGAFLHSLASWRLAKNAMAANVSRLPDQIKPNLPLYKDNSKIT